MKGFTAAQSHYDNMMPEDDEDKTIEQCLEDLGYDVEVISVGITVIRKGLKHNEFDSRYSY